MTEKEFKSIDEQIEILISRGLIIDDFRLAREFLLYNNYYRVSGYTLTLRKKDIFYNGVTFENIIEIYDFDAKLRKILFEYIEHIEVKLKSILVYEFTKKYGAYGYIEYSNFSDKYKYFKIINSLNNYIIKRENDEKFIRHYKNKNEIIPFWAVVDLFTLSDISKIYKLLDEELKLLISKYFKFKTTNAGELLGKFMHSITIVRNLCAHGNRLYNRYFQQKPFLSKKELNLLRKNKNGEKENNRLYSFIIVLKRLLTEEDFKKLKNDISKLKKSYNFVDLKYYGFREDWKEL